MVSCTGNTTALEGSGLCCGPSSSLPHVPWGQQLWHWNGGCESLQHLREKLRSGWRIFSSQSGGEILGVPANPRPSLPCPSPWQGQGMKERLLLVLPLLFHYPQNHAHNKHEACLPRETLADRKASGAGGSTALQGIFPHPRGCPSS